MKSRRDFIKEAATGALLLGSSAAADKLARAAMLNRNAQHAETGKSRVVVARDAALRGTAGGPGAPPDEKRVLELLDRAIAAYTGRDKPVEAWKRIVPVGKVIGFKINCLGGKPIPTHLVLVLAVCERLQQAGVKPGEIVVWECRNEDLERAGYTINTDRSRVRCYGSDTAGYEDEPVAFGTVNVKLSKILSRECEMVISLPILKDHDPAGITFSMKNMYGGVENPRELHPGGCNPAVADLNCIPAIREKVRFTIGDAMSSVYDGGPSFHPERLWYPNALIVGEDRVAVDRTAWQIIERKRAEVGMPTLEAVGRPPRYIATAADSAHQLGVNDPKRIHLMEI